MRTILSLIALSLLSYSVCANEIDKLKTFDDVNRFVNEKIAGAPIKDGILKKNRSELSIYGKDKFYKLDLDNNGTTDLVIDGYYLIAITDDGQEGYGVHLLDRRSNSNYAFSLVKIVRHSSRPVLVLRRFMYGEHGMGFGPKKLEKHIEMKFGDFIEVNRKPEHHPVDEIKFSTSRCYRKCPEFELMIENDGAATYNAIRFNKLNGKFYGTIDPASLEKLMQTIEYANINKVEESYGGGHVDDQWATLVVKFKDGTTKKISDDGLMGTFGLMNIYRQLFGLRDSQQWMKLPGNLTRGKIPESGRRCYLGVKDLSHAQDTAKGRNTC